MTETQRELSLCVRAAGLIISYGGRVPRVKVTNMVKRCGITGQVRHGTGRRATDLAYRAIKVLRMEGLVKSEGGDYVALDLVELGAWLADELERFGERQSA